MTRKTLWSSYIYNIYYLLHELKLSCLPHVGNPHTLDTSLAYVIVDTNELDTMRHTKKLQRPQPLLGPRFIIKKRRQWYNIRDYNYPSDSLPWTTTVYARYPTPLEYRNELLLDHCPTARVYHITPLTTPPAEPNEYSFKKCPWHRTVELPAK